MFVRDWLQDDKVDILARPQFVQISKDNITLSAIRIFIGVESKLISETAAA
jgi:Stage V sporulation protein S (SpoVS)